MGGASRVESLGTESIAPYAIEYDRIIFLGAITSIGYSAIIRAGGNARYSTAIWIIPVSVNIVLCWLFIVVLQMGISGADLTTVSGQTVSASMSVYFFFFEKEPLLPHPGALFQTGLVHYRRGADDWRRPLSIQPREALSRTAA
jgi:Na+-driven multidrug efflux pump